MAVYKLIVLVVFYGNEIIMNIYLDIDGVLITKKGKSAKGVVEFIKYVTDHHSVYWLTTHCKGVESTAIKYLQDKLPPRVLQYLKKIKPTNWQTLKTEAIDFSQDLTRKEKFIVLKTDIARIEIDEVNERIDIVDTTGRKEIPFVHPDFQGASRILPVLTSVINEDGEISSAEDGLKALEILVGIHLAHERGMKVDFPLKDQDRTKVLSIP